MANYTQTNIYRKQMNELGLNTMQYAKLLDVPYEVVKDVIYDKEGDYSMEIKNLLRNTMFKRHQEIENDYENAKLKSAEIKLNNNEIDYLKWYNDEYTPQLLKKTLNVRTISEFVRKYDLKMDGVKFSNWVYQLLSNKREYEGHHIEPNKKLEFIKQLYDIIVNKNKDNYKADKIVFEGVSNNTQELYNWYKSFDFAEFRKKYGISNGEIANDLRISYSTMGHLATNDYFCTSLIRRFYNYVNSMDEYNNIQNEKKVMLDWFNNFDFKKYFKQNKITQNQFANLCDVSLQNINRIINQKKEQKTLTNSIRNIYKYIHNQKEIVGDFKDITNDQNIENDEQIEVLDLTETPSNDFTNDITDECPCENVSQPDNNEMLRRILINRLTDEEKELIRIFGGKLD